MGELNTSLVRQENDDSTNEERYVESPDTGTPTENHNDDTENNAPSFYRWSPSGIWYRDLLHFVGPGWFVCIAYVDPGNYQADIQAGATSRYNLLWTLWWSSLLSIYVQVLCVRLAVYGQVTLAEVQSADSSKAMRYLNWAIAEFTAVITDLPEVIGIGIAFNVFFGWPYYVGVILSLLTTMSFLAVASYGIRILEVIIVVFVGIMSIALWTEMSFVGVETGELWRGWIYGFVDVTSDDIFSITGILGAIVMPHNLYLHTAACQTRRVVREEIPVKEAVRWSSLEPVLPVLVSFFVNMAVIAIAAETVNGTADEPEKVGLTDFCYYFQKLKGGCVLWGIALLAAGQSSAITTTYTGQYIMDGFLHMRLPTWARAVLTRLVAIAPCVIVSAAFPTKLNHMVNIVNAALSFLLPFAFTPLVKYTTSVEYMGRYAPPLWERYLLRGAAVFVYLLNAVSLSITGGGFFGFIFKEPMSVKNGFYAFLMAVIQAFYFWWNLYTMMKPISTKMMPLEEERPYDEAEFAITSGVGDKIGGEKAQMMPIYGQDDSAPSPDFDDSIEPMAMSGTIT